LSDPICALEGSFDAADDAEGEKGQDAVGQRRLDLLGLNLVRGELVPVVEAAGSPRAPAEYPGALALLDLAADRDLVAGELDVHVFALDARKLGLDHVRVVFLLNVDERPPASRITERGLVEAAKRLVEYPPHTVARPLKPA
jgi:hypothetical protein